VTRPRLAPLAYDDLDDETKGTVSELAGCPSFLHALEDYVGRTRILH
jgi:hypothetical protein